MRRFHLRTTTRSSDDVFSAAEIARAAGVSAARVRTLVHSGHVIAFRGFVAPVDAVRLVLELSGRVTHSADQRVPLAQLTDERPSRFLSLFASGVAHAAFLLALIAAIGFGLLNANKPADMPRPEATAKLVYLMAPGPGGGGGGGGQQAAVPPSIVKVATPLPKAKPPSHLPVVVHHIPPPPRPSPSKVVARMTFAPRPVEAPEPSPIPAIQAPVRSIVSDQLDAAGIPAAKALLPSPGPGIGGGGGTGAGTGSGPGVGSGLGSGSGGGTGGGPYRAGAGIDPPRPMQTMRPGYTDEARRQAIEGRVLLEIVVRKDGSVDNVRVLKSLPAGLDEKAIEAVRQWRFAPAHRNGEAVDVVAEVNVDFTLR